MKQRARETHTHTERDRERERERERETKEWIMHSQTYNLLTLQKKCQIICLF